MQRAIHTLIIRKGPFRHMFAAAFGKVFRRTSLPRHAVPAGTRVYAVGDVHGCADELNRLLDAIDQDLGQDAVQSHLVFLGDLVDRGPNSAAVLDRILEGGLPTDRCDCIMGNHEEVMLACYEDHRDVHEGWLRFGGLQTLESYGLKATDILAPAFDVAKAMREAVPPKHIQFLRSLKDIVRLGDYVFVHAGVRPKVPLQKQSSRDLRWIRDGFLNDTSDHGFKVVHGHTIVPKVEFHPNRIAVDTGCYFTGRLSAVVLEANAVRVLTSQD